MRLMHNVLLLFCFLVLLTTGCSQDMVYNRSVTDLNVKAKALLSQGDAAGAVARLESAIDLMPEEMTTLYNLAVAYQANGQLEKSIETFEQLLEKDAAKKTEIQRSLAILHEARADKTIADALSTDETTGEVKELSKENKQQAQEKALQDYTKALDYYQRSVENSDEQAALEEHIQFLKQQVSQIEAGKLSTQLQAE